MLVVDFDRSTGKAYPEAESSPHPANATDSTTFPANPTNSTLVDQDSSTARHHVRRAPLDESTIRATTDSRADRKSVV